MQADPLSPNLSLWHPDRLRQMLRTFRRDDILRARLVNISHLLSGNFASAMIALVGVAIAARSLGPAQYGILALVISYGRVVERVMRFESWQPLIKYAAAIEGQNAKDDLRRLFAFGFRLDVAACLAAGLTSAGLALVASPLFGLAAKHVELVLIYSLALALNINGMPTAALRLGGRFRTIAYAQVAANVVRVAWCLFGLWKGASLSFFAWAWAGSQIFGSMLFLLLAWIELNRQGIKNILTAPWKGVTDRFPGIMGFAWSSNLSMTIRSSSHDLDVLLVGALADPTSAGLYYIAKRFAKMVQQINAQVQAVLYPDVARLWASSAYKAFSKSIVQIQILLAGFGITAFLLALGFGKWLIAMGPGVKFLGAQPLLLVQIVAITLTTHSAPSRTALLAMGKQASVLHIAFFATLIFHATLLLLVPRIGAMGANIAHVLLALICAIVMDSVMRRGIAAARTLKRGHR
jgi:O-antigen/teichoic acid export membrane protein